MSYTINKTDGTIVATVEDGVLDTTTSLPVDRYLNSCKPVLFKPRCIYIGQHTIDRGKDELRVDR